MNEMKRNEYSLLSAERSSEEGVHDISTTGEINNTLKDF